ncbi:hypothetical protein TNIN_230571 [Trichonephila inaurata madagascariensis]|uniref:Uncharacterized protein n=1 Tax=Trichonephila inaurata madagascariensis TaxID=2747483 RepID=A0A8X7C8E8_9ARAC|nr:hypothetical protein TNIN_230571 [Trichonephila inaurata madagascariensis]
MIVNTPSGGGTKQTESIVPISLTPSLLIWIPSTCSIFFRQITPKNKDPVLSSPIAEAKSFRNPQNKPTPVEEQSAPNWHETGDDILKPCSSPPRSRRKAPVPDEVEKHFHTLIPNDDGKKKLLRTCAAT